MLHLQVFAWTAAYFLVDSVLIVFYQGSMWKVFLGACPYFFLKKMLSQRTHTVGRMRFCINCSLNFPKLNLKQNPTCSAPRGRMHALKLCMPLD
jgi:hypothetical protein